ncbi:MAG: large conductance mechanosensitive channel protein MscL [Clostridiales bacterium]|nr:large conductance mechanosensitive channel protein MscL [Clostridiales bacterium]
MKKFFSEFKAFITRGNVLDMAVGVIVGGAFTAIVTALTGQILQPLINWMLASIMGGDGLEAAVTMLKPAYTEGADGVKVIDLANSIYINWGAFITAIINFILVALILFCIVKAINHVHEKGKQAAEKRKKKGEVVEEAPAEVAPEPAPAPETSEQILAEIRDLLKAQNATPEDKKAE